MIPTLPVIASRIRPPFHLLVADDTASVLAGLCRLLESQSRIRIVGTATHGNEALQMAEVLQPDVVLLDLNLPLVDGFHTTALLRRRLPDIRVIIMSDDDSSEAQAAAQAHGAHGFIWKPQMMSVLMTEISRAFQLNLN